MSQSTNNGQKDTLSIQNSTDTDNKSNSHLVEAEPISGTPFVMVHILDLGWFIGYSGERITDVCETREAAAEKLVSEMWELIFHMIIITIERHRQNVKMAQSEELNSHNVHLE